MALSGAGRYVNESGKGRFPAGARFFFLNQPEYLDQPGEYWLDQATGLLYLLPPAGGFAGASLSVASGPLFEIRPGADDITFRGLTLIAGQAAAIKCGTLDYPPTYDCGATNVRVEGCAIRGFGSSGIQVD